MRHLHPTQVSELINAGGIIAYPTEGVYGLGCDPDNVGSIERLLTIKQRPWEKGLIIVASRFEQLADYVDFSQLTDEQINTIKSHWPGAVTQIMPAKQSVSTKLKGQFDTIAIRISAHPTVIELCNSLGKPLVSTSANIAGEPPAMSGDEIEAQFSEQIDALIEGELGGRKQPSTIIDARTGQVLR
ncbi:threonylcarbamoyl-AMP synthase [Parashewanella curva]|uniref:Threonylcarbamoyl-AMP synthase n=1 Tax=Parashewanella curva TaxID=2338552 RepID=A0A3L8Q0D9_9GAMM|nr:L-threonylcarbamoyladenylate synthase [Parashewanella curva]RLV60890.1 threonylcarbamoyl-AMP synthase [Parashewanella curva]